MRQGFTQLQQKSPATGASAGAIGMACSVTRLGEVRPYSPFGLMILDGSVEVGRERSERRVGIRKEMRGRTGLAA